MRSIKCWLLIALLAALTLTTNAWAQDLVCPQGSVATQIQGSTDIVCVSQDQIVNPTETNAFVPVEENTTETAANETPSTADENTAIEDPTQNRTDNEENTQIATDTEDNTINTEVTEIAEVDETVAETSETTPPSNGEFGKKDFKNPEGYDEEFIAKYGPLVDGMPFYKWNLILTFGIGGGAYGATTMFKSATSGLDYAVAEMFLQAGFRFAKHFALFARLDVGLGGPYKYRFFEAGIMPALMFNAGRTMIVTWGLAIAYANSSANDYKIPAGMPLASLLTNSPSLKMVLNFDFYINDRMAVGFGLIAGASLFAYYFGASATVQYTYFFDFRRTNEDKKATLNNRLFADDGEEEEYEYEECAPDEDCEEYYEDEE